MLAQIKNKQFLAVIILAALAIRLIVSWQSVPTLVEKIVLDDSFYGFSIAKHIALGNGITYNGADIVNGLQPIWIFLISPVYMITADINLAVNIILTMQAALDMLVIFLIYRLSKDLFGEKTGLLAAFIWAMNPLVIFQMLAGIDVTMYVLMILFTIFFYNKVKDRLDFKNIIVLGALLGITFLARGDGIFLLATIAAAILVRSRNKTLAFKQLAVLGMIALLVVVPWIARSYLLFGTIRQSSEIANYGASHGTIPYFDVQPPQSISDVASKIAENFVRVFGSLANQMGVVDFGFSVATIALVMFYAVSIVGSRKSLKKFAIPIIFSSLLILFYAGYLWGIQMRYMAPIVPFIVMLASAGFIDLVYNKIGKKSLFAIAVLAILLSFNGIQQWDRGYFSWQKEIYSDALWVEENTPQDAIIGGFASGIPIYFSNRTMINLDGVLNFDAIDAIMNRSMYSYMKSRNISYWIESSYHNQTAIDRYNAGTFDIMKENQWNRVFEQNANLDLIENRCEVYKHLRGFDMLVCFMKVKVN